MTTVNNGTLLTKNNANNCLIELKKALGFSSLDDTNYIFQKIILNSKLNKSRKVNLRQ